MAPSPTVEVVRETEARLGVLVGGDWSLGASPLPWTEAIRRELEGGAAVSRIVVEPRELGRWDSSLVAFAHALGELASAHGAALDLAALPEGVRRLVALASAVPPRELHPEEPDDALTARVGSAALHAWGTFSEALDFTGRMLLAGGALLRGRAYFRPVDLLGSLEASGVAALGIVALINFLIGAVLAFVGAVQLQQFGATIYVADLVAVGIARELGALMTGIVMAGRTGASFAAVLGSMTVNEEVDALQTTGIDPFQFLVLPRVLATVLMLPALVAYADLLGMLGGMFVGVALLGLGTTQFVQQLLGALALRHVVIGLVKGAAFGLVVAMTGCFYGLRCGRSAAAVGDATTRSVVMGIVFVVIVDAVFTVALHFLHL
jgi:phospholipid/cholesterol/gamma-HCH transport system permease protein